MGLLEKSILLPIKDVVDQLEFLPQEDAAVDTAGDAGKEKTIDDFSASIAKIKNGYLRVSAATYLETSCAAQGVHERFQAPKIGSFFS